MGDIQIGQGLGAANSGGTISVRLPNGKVVQARAGMPISTSDVVVLTDESGQSHAFAQSSASGSVVTKSIYRNKRKPKPAIVEDDYNFKVLQPSSIEGFDANVALDLTGYEPVGITNTGDDYVYVVFNENLERYIVGRNSNSYEINDPYYYWINFFGYDYLDYVYYEGSYSETVTPTPIVFPITYRALSQNDYMQVLYEDGTEAGESSTINFNFLSYENDTIFGSYACNCNVDEQSVNVLGYPFLGTFNNPEGSYNLTYNDKVEIRYVYNDNGNMVLIQDVENTNHTETGGRTITNAVIDNVLYNGLPCYSHYTIKDEINLNHKRISSGYKSPFASPSHINKTTITRSANNYFEQDISYSYQYITQENYELRVSYLTLGWDPRLDPTTGILLGYDLNGESTPIDVKWGDIRHTVETGEWRGARVSDIQSGYGCEPGFFSGYRFCGTYYYLFGDYGLGSVNELTTGHVFTNDLNKVARGFTIVPAEEPYIANASGFSAREEYVDTRVFINTYEQTSSLQKAVYNENNSDEYLFTTPYIIGKDCAIYEYRKDLRTIKDNRNIVTQYLPYSQSGSGNKVDTDYDFSKLVVKVNNTTYEVDNHNGTSLDLSKNVVHISYNVYTAMTPGVKTYPISFSYRGSTKHHHGSYTNREKILTTTTTSWNNATPTKTYTNVLDKTTGSVTVVQKQDGIYFTNTGTLSDLNKTVNNETFYITYNSASINFTNDPISDNYFCGEYNGTYIFADNDFTSFLVEIIPTLLTRTNLYIVKDEQGNDTVELAIAEIPTDTAEKDEWRADIYRFNTATLKWERRPNAVSALSQLTAPSDFISYHPTPSN